MAADPGAPSEADPALLYRTAPSNHGCLTDGDVTREVETFCRQAGITVVRCDSDEGLRRHLDALAAM